VVTNESADNSIQNKVTMVKQKEDEMNQEAAMQELNGQTLKLLDLYSKKETALKSIEDGGKQLVELDLQIRELSGIIQTLNFLIRTEGFTKLDGVSQQGGQPTKAGRLPPIKKE
jgi:hypothetical protein